VLQAPGASCTPAHFSHSRRFAQSRPGWFSERSKHLWPGCCPHHIHRKWIPTEPKDWRRLSGLNTSIWHCLGHWSSLQTEQKHAILVYPTGGSAASRSMFQDTHTWAITLVLADPNITAFLKVLSLHQFCSNCTPMTCQLHVAENSFTLTTYEGCSKSFATWHDNVKVSMHGMYQ